MNETSNVKKFQEITNTYIYILSLYRENQHETKQTSAHRTKNKPNTQLLDWAHVSHISYFLGWPDGQSQNLLLPFVFFNLVYIFLLLIEEICLLSSIIFYFIPRNTVFKEQNLLSLGRGKGEEGNLSSFKTTDVIPWCVSCIHILCIWASE